MVAAVPPSRRPTHTAGEAQRVQQRRIVLLDPRGQDVTLPRRGGNLEAVELADDGREALQSSGPVLGIHPLPGEQEPHEIRWAHRLDLRAEAVERVAVDPRQQPPLAPLQLDRGVAVARTEAAAEHHSLRLQRDERRLDLDLRHTQARRERGRGGGADDAEASAHELAHGGLPRRRIGQQVHLRPALGGDPDGRPAVGGLDSRRTPGLGQLVHVPGPVGALGLGQEARGEQGVVQLVRIPDLRPDLFPHPLDGGGIQRAEVVRGGGLEGAAGVHRLGAALLQGRVVEELVGPGVEDLVRQRRSRQPSSPTGPAPSTSACRPPVSSSSPACSSHGSRRRTSRYCRSPFSAIVSGSVSTPTSRNALGIGTR